MLKYDLHTHTFYSKCSNMKPEILLKTAKKHKLNGIAVTDHGTIKGALNVKRLNKDKNFEVIVGEEVSTQYGDVLAYYLKKQIKTTDFFKLVEEVKKQNGLVIIPHPFRATLLPTYKFKLSLDKVKDKIDAIECFNARMIFSQDNKKADNLANKLNIAKTGGSDAHFKFEIATGYTLFEGNLRKAFKNRKTRVDGTIRYGAFGGLLSFLRKRV
jgi:hypothetical protein